MKTLKNLLIKLPLIAAVLFMGIGMNYILKTKPKTIPVPIKKIVNIGKDVAPHVTPFRDPEKGFRRRATGFHIKFHGKTYIVTNKHVCDIPLKRKQNNILFGQYIGTILKVSKKHDLCLVTSNRKEGLTIAEDMPSNFDPIYLVGYPRGIGKVIRKGHIIEKKVIRASWLGFGKGNLVETYLISTISYGGNSGSPVVDKYGEVMGVLFAGSMSYHTEGLIVPLSDLKLFLYSAVFTGE